MHRLSTWYAILTRQYVWSSVVNVGEWLLQESPPLSINDIDLKYVAQFKYLGHVINNDFIDNDDIKRETRNMFIRSNILIRCYRAVQWHCAKRAEAHFWAKAPEIIPQF